MDLVHAGHVLGLAVDVLHVVDVDADVLGGDVAAAQRFHELAERAEQRLGLVGGGVADDHRLAAADVQAGDRVLVGHAAAQAQHVVEGFRLALVRPHAGAAQGRTQHGVVDGDDRLQACVLVVAEHDLLMAVGVEGFEDHCGNSGRSRSRVAMAPTVWKGRERIGGDGLHRMRRGRRCRARILSHRSCRGLNTGGYGPVAWLAGSPSKINPAGLHPWRACVRIHLHRVECRASGGRLRFGPGGTP